MLSTISSAKTRFLAIFFIAMIALLIVPISLGCAQAPPEKEMDRLTWRAAWISADPAMVTGVEKGFWADEGIDLELKFGAGISNTQLIGAGVELFASEGYEDMIVAVQSGLPIKAVFCYQQVSPIAIISRADAPIRHPKDLEGKSIAAGPGSGSAAMLPAVMKAAGADFSKVTVNIVDWGAIQEMLMLEKVDAIPLYWTNTVPELAEKGVETYYIKYSDYGINVLSQGLIVSDELIAENPDLIRRFVRALQKAHQYTIEHPEEAIDILVKDNPDYDRETELKSLQNDFTLLHTPNTEGKPLGWMAKEDWELSQDIMIEYLELENRLPVESYFTNEFIP